MNPRTFRSILHEDVPPDQPELFPATPEKRKVGPKAKGFFKLRDLLAAQATKGEEEERRANVRRILARESAHAGDEEAYRVVDGFSAYHATMKENLPEIRQHGLRTDMVANEGNFTHGAIFFATMDQCRVLAAQLSDIGEEAVILEVYIPRGRTVYKDMLMPADTSFYIRQGVPPRHIRVLGQDYCPVADDTYDFRRNLRRIIGPSPREFAETVRRYPRDSVKPWLFTFEEYRKLVNQGGKSHPSSAYQTTVSRLNSYIRKEKYTHLIKRIKGIEYRVRKEKMQYLASPNDFNDRSIMSPEQMAAKGIPDTRVDIAAFDGDDCVGGAQDEWGCVLYMVAAEYKGEGIGTNLAHLYWSIYPGKDSGGFTIAGSQVHARVWNRFVADAIKYKKYDRAIAAGEITKEKAEAIIASYEKDRHLHPEDPDREPPRLKWQRVADDLLRRAQKSPYITDPTSYEDVRQIILGDDKLGMWMWTEENDWWTQELYDTVLPLIKRKLTGKFDTEQT